MNLTDTTDGLLIARSQQGDRYAFDMLLKRHQARAYRYATQLTHDAEEAGDVVAETAVRMFKGIGSFRGNSSFTTWMHRVTTNCFLDIKKRRRLVCVSLASTSDLDGQETEFQVAEKGPSPFDLISIREDLDAVKRAVNLLVKWQKRILILRYTELRSYEEIATLLGVPIGTVKSRINRARGTLRSNMALGIRGSYRPV